MFFPQQLSHCLTLNIISPFPNLSCQHLRLAPITSRMDYNSLQDGLTLFHEKNRGSHLWHDYYGAGTGQSISYILSCLLLTASLWDTYILLSASPTAETVEGQERENALPKITQPINDSAQLQTQASGAHAYCPVLGVEKSLSLLTLAPATQFILADQCPRIFLKHNSCYLLSAFSGNLTNSPLSIQQSPRISVIWAQWTPPILLCILCKNSVSLYGLWARRLLMPFTHIWLHHLLLAFVSTSTNWGSWYCSCETEFFVFCFFNKFILFYLFLAALGLCCCVPAFSSYGERELLFVAVHGLLIAVASLVVEHRL